MQILHPVHVSRNKAFSVPVRTGVPYWNGDCRSGSCCDRHAFEREEALSRNDLKLRFRLLHLFVATTTVREANHSFGINRFYEVGGIA